MSESKPVFTARGISVRALLVGSMVTVLALLLLANALNYVFVSRLNQALVVMEEETERAEATLEVDKATADLFVVLAQGALSRDPAHFVQTVEEAIQTLDGAEERLVESSSSIPPDDPLRLQLYVFRTDSDSARHLAENLLQSAEAGEWGQIEQVEQSLIPYYRRLVVGAAEDVRTEMSGRRSAAVAEAETLRRMVQAVPAVAGLLVVTVLAGMLFALTRAITRPIGRLTDTAAQLTSGHLEERVRIERVDEFRRLAIAFNEMANQLQISYSQLEQRVAERTRALRAAADVARATTSVLDLDELLTRVVNLVRERFDLYYVGLFLLDQDTDDSGRTFAVLQAGTGEFGQQMLAQGHRLEMGGDSMIGQCVAWNEVGVALDVGEEAVRFDNPLLPDTRSELALPLRSRGRVVGAMTVQSVKEAAFDEEYISALQTMADQVAVAIDNARLFAESQAALDEMEITQRRYLGQAWAEYASVRPVSGYEQTQAGITPLGGEILPQVRQALIERRPLIWRGDGARVGESSLASADLVESPDLVVPILLRDQPIGALGFRAKESGTWSEDDVALAEAVAEQLALAADNLRLLDATQRNAARERLTREITDKISTSFDFETALRTTVEELSTALGASGASVELDLSGEKA